METQREYDGQVKPPARTATLDAHSQNCQATTRQKIATRVKASLHVSQCEKDSVIWTIEEAAA
jgi:hypothetical protein